MQGSVQLYIRTTHTVGDLDQQLELIDDVLIDDLYIEIQNLPSFSPPTPPMVFTGDGVRVEAELQFGVACDGNRYGPFCDVECVGRDNSDGHYECNQDGVIECLEGYQNLETNCTECVAADGCSKSSISYSSYIHVEKLGLGLLEVGYCSESFTGCCSEWNL